MKFIESIILHFLKKFLGNYVKGLTTDNFDFSFKQKKMKFKNIEIANDLVDMLDWPINQKYSIIKKLSIVYDHFNLEKVPVVVKMEGVTIVV